MTQESLAIQSRLGEVRTVRRWLEPILSRALPSPSGRFQLSVALTEVLTNIIRHGYRGEENHQIRVTVEELPSSVRISVYDTGDPWDPRKATLPDLDQPREGGYGSHLIMKYVDELEYLAGAENLLRLTKRKGAP